MWKTKKGHNDRQTTIKTIVPHTPRYNKMNAIKILISSDYTISLFKTIAHRLNIKW